MKKSKLRQMGKKITDRAKAIRKKHPGMKWQNAVKKAGKELKGKL
jgi:hypothetical protein